MEPLETAKHELLEAAGRTAQSFGITRLFGQLYMFLFLCPEPACLDEIAESLGVSKASTSLACRQLESWGTLRKVWKKGDRKDYYEAITDLGAILNNGLLAAINKKLESGAIQIERSLNLLEQSKEDPKKIESVRERILEAEKYRHRLEKVLNNPLVRKLF